MTPGQARRALELRGKRSRTNTRAGQSWRDIGVRYGVPARVVQEAVRQVLKDDELIAEVEHLWGTDTLPNIATRLGYKTTKGLGERLRKAGRNDLAAPFKAISKQQEKANR
jgi:predicted regulator of amino acid metabolism with ACT domain